MKKAIILAVFVVACARSDEGATDTAAMAGPAPITAADITGTWNGVSMAEASDSVLARWTVVSPTGADSRVVTEGSADTVSYMHTFDADSFVATSAPYTDATMPGSPQVTARAVGRLIAGKLVGTAAIMLASNPDSVLSRARWEATRSP